jgi:hypothetical protein
MPKTKPAAQDKPKEPQKEPYQFKSLQGWPQKKEKTLEEFSPSRASVKS